MTGKKWTDVERQAAVGLGVTGTLPGFVMKMTILGSAACLIWILIALANDRWTWMTTGLALLLPILLVLAGLSARSVLARLRDESKPKP